ncbi:SDR family NAD(P)-dependent oxidoreductase [Polaromonas jejuensis]|uniref:SDR family NAD(P)-dependent oxidoreductase n=1 Tax=Polaromonas jejuensis TaxID=457502 RepID=A0ABW0Q7Y4_9BURK|nr:SDR family oxidoreductase [Polaromonas jejuensis]
MDGKVAVVTGGSSGIGAACVRALAAEGASVVIGYHRGQARAEDLCAELPKLSVEQVHRVLPIPLGDGMAHAEVARALQAAAGRVDILVNSAGFTRRIAHTDLESLDDAVFNEILVANAGGPFSITRALMPLLRVSGDALVVNVSSISAFTGSGSNIAYCAAKAALDTMTISLARAFGPAVRFLCISPAAVDTGFVEGRSRAELEKKSAQTPLGRIVTPDDVALAVLACATHLKTATGTRIVVDGGHQL